MTPDGTRPVTSLTAGKAPVPLTLSRVAHDTSFAPFIFLSSFGDGPSLNKRLPPFGNKVHHAFVEEAVSIWRVIATLNVKIFLLIRRMYIKPT